MKYGIVLFGVKDSTEEILHFLRRTHSGAPQLLVTIKPEVTKKNEISGYKSLSGVAKDLGIPVYEAARYDLKDEETLRFFAENEFDLGLVSGWQRLIPGEVLSAFRRGIFGFHGNAGYLPFGRGRSPLNWSLYLGDSRFNLNLFRYDEAADSPNVFATESFSLTEYDDIRTAQYKNTLAQEKLLAKLLAAYEAAEADGGEIPVKTASRDYDSWYGKRTPADGRLDFSRRTRELYDHIRSVAPPFPGAFAYLVKASESGDLEREFCPGRYPEKTLYQLDEETLTARIGAGRKVRILAARPFDDRMDFSGYAPGEVMAVFDGRVVVRTVDGSLLLDKLETECAICPGDRFL